MNAIGNPVTPVTAYPVVTTPATNVNGMAAPQRNTPSRDSDSYLTWTFALQILHVKLPAMVCSRMTQAGTHCPLRVVRPPQNGGSSGGSSPRSWFLSDLGGSVPDSSGDRSMMGPTASGSTW